MSNQASEDELRVKILDEMLYDSRIELNSDLNGDLIEPNEALDGIVALIRTEKLKLLAGVRERVVGAKNDLYFKNKIPQTLPEYIDEVVKVREQLRVEQRTALTQLEAEL